MRPWLNLPLLLLATPAYATTLTWHGSVSSLWSDAGNWSPAQAPADGDDLEFDVVSGVSLVDTSVALGSLTYLPGSPIEIHTAADLAFTGAGVVNLSIPNAPGPNRQQLVADAATDAATPGGSITFRNGASINEGIAVITRNVDLIARGAYLAGAAGGRVSLVDDSSSGAQTGLLAEGGAVAGAAGGAIVFEGRATLSEASAMALRGGSVAGAAGGSAVFRDESTADSLITVQSADGAGGRLTFEDQARLGASTNLFNDGAFTVADGAEGFTRFAGSSTSGAGAIQNGPAGVASAAPGHTEFTERSTAGELSFGAIPGVIINGGSYVPDGSSGFTRFSDDAVAANVLIRNQIAMDAEDVSGLGGVTYFRHRSRLGAGARVSNAGGVAQAGATLLSDEATADLGALVVNEGGEPRSGFTQVSDSASTGAATIVNEGSPIAGGYILYFDRATGGTSILENQAATAANSASGAGNARFRGFSNASDASIVNRGSDNTGWGGITGFEETASAGRARIENEGAGVPGSQNQSGNLFFAGDASAEEASIVNRGGRAAGAAGGRTVFSGRAGAGQATLTNESGAAANAISAQLWFDENASAERAFVTNQGGVAAAAPGGLTAFSGDASAGEASIRNAGATNAGGGSSITSFSERATAANATIVNDASVVADPSSPIGNGNTFFIDDSNAGSATIVSRGATLAGARGGSTAFFGRSEAGSATLSAEGGLGTDFTTQNHGGIFFEGSSSADRARIHILRAPSAGGAVFRKPGAASFNSSSTAASAEIDVEGRLLFAGNSTAGEARIANLSGLDFSGATTLQGGSSGGTALFRNQGATANSVGGTLLFAENATADHATIVNEGTPLFNGEGGTTVFSGSATAGSAAITNGSAGALGGLTLFRENSSAGAATIRNHDGGSTVFFESSNAGTATLITELGPNGGAAVVFEGLAEGRNARMIAGAGTILDVSQVSDGVVTLGSLEGEGVVGLGRNALSVGANGRDTTFNGVASDGGLNTAAGGSLRKIGTGTLALGGENTYTGLTVAESGTLLVNGSLAGDARVLAGGMLGGSGTIAGNVNVDPGGIFSPGTSPGTIRLGGDLLLDAAAVLLWDVGVVSDLAIIEGDVVLDGFLDIRVEPGYALDGFGFELFVYGGNLIDRGLEIRSVPEGLSREDFIFQTTTPGRFGVSYVPEPSTALLVASGVGALALRSRRAGRTPG